ncbi:MAG: MMPL family transporter [Desulforegulaceae bacterium]|nr:MMPL family transporter [Desulforegulaceae bacterium]
MNTDFIVKHNKLFLFIPLFFALIFFYHIPKVKNVEDVDHFIIQDDPENLYYIDFKKVFGNDEFFIIAFKGNNLFSEASLNLLKKITEELKEIDEVKDVKSLANIDETIGYDDFFEVRPFLEAIPSDSIELENLKKRAVTNPLYLNNFISDDGNTFALLIEAFDKPDDYDYRFRLIEKTKQVLNKYQNIKFYLAGKTVTDTSMTQYMEKDLNLLIPLSYLFIALCVFYFFRSIILTIVSVINISFCLGSTMGFMGLLDITQNSVTSIVMPLIMALALCDTVHIYSFMTLDELKKNGNDKIKAMGSVLRKNIKPCFLTSLTTGIGFLSLYTSKLVPIKEFALTACAGVFFEFLFSFTLLPSILLFFKAEKIFKNHSKKSFIWNLLNLINKIVLDYSRYIILISIFVFFICSALILNIKIETNIVEFFKKNSSLRQSLEFVEENLSGVETFDISLYSTQRDAFKNPEHLVLMEKIEKYINSLEGIDKTISFNNFIKDMNKSFHNENNDFYKIPESSNLVAQYLLLYDSDDIEDYINSDYNHARITIRISEHSSLKQKELIEKIKKYLKKTENDQISLKLTGRVLQDVIVIDEIFAGQIKSLGTAFIIISIVFFFVFRSFKTGLVSMVPNAFPILINFGVMGLLGIPLNTATALISAVAIGIAVDDTIHFISEFRTNEKKHNDAEKLLTHVLFKKGSAIISSSLILCIGFGVLGFSSFIPTFQFGVLCALIMISAVVSDLFLLPVLLKIIK